MKTGQQVTYTKGRSKKDATIVGITGSGPSGYKTLDLLFANGKVAKDVPHKNDDAKEGYWE